MGLFVVGRVIGGMLAGEVGVEGAPLAGGVGVEGVGVLPVAGGVVVVVPPVLVVEGVVVGLFEEFAGGAGVAVVGPSGLWVKGRAKGGEGADR